MDDIERLFTAVGVLLAILWLKWILCKRPRPNYKEKSEHSLGQCPVCWEDEQRFQMRTDCGHSFCGGCTISCYDVGMTLRRLKCPVCREDVSILYECFTKEELDAPRTDPAGKVRRKLQKKLRDYNMRFSGGSRPLWHSLEDLPLRFSNLWSSLDPIEALRAAGIVLIPATALLRAASAQCQLLSWLSFLTNTVLLAAIIKQLTRHYLNYTGTLSEFVSDIYQYTTRDNRIAEISIYTIRELLILVGLIFFPTVEVGILVSMLVPSVKETFSAITARTLVAVIAETAKLIFPLACVLTLNDVLFSNLPQI